MLAGCRWPYSLRLVGFVLAIGPEGQVRSEQTKRSRSISLVLERMYDYTRKDVFQGRNLLKLLPSLYSVNDDDDNIIDDNSNSSNSS